MVRTLILAAGLLATCAAHADEAGKQFNAGEVAGLLNGLGSQIQRCWSLSPDAHSVVQNMDVDVSFELDLDGNLVGAPSAYVTEAGSDSGAKMRGQLADSVIRAVARCAPYRAAPGKMSVHFRMADQP